MKIYLWGRVDALKQYTPGMAFAHADDKEEAIRLIVETYVKQHYTDEYKTNRLRNELEQKEPEVIGGRYGHAELGSA